MESTQSIENNVEKKTEQESKFERPIKSRRFQARRNRKTYYQNSENGLKMLDGDIAKLENKVEGLKHLKEIIQCKVDHKNEHTSKETQSDTEVKEQPNEKEIQSELKRERRRFKRKNPQKETKQEVPIEKQEIKSNSEHEEK